jgi:hypothetical protein
MHGPRLLAVITSAIALSGAVAEVRAETATPGPSWVIDGRLGAAMLMKSRSKALGHLFKPDLLVSARRTLGERLEAGAALSALIAGSEHYRVLGLLAHARYAVWRPGRVSLGISGALGAGHDADILHRDLSADGSVAPYGFVAADGRWAIGQRWFVGLEVGFENLSMLQLGARVGWRLR